MIAIMYQLLYEEHPDVLPSRVSLELRDTGTLENEALVMARDYASSPVEITRIGHKISKPYNKRERELTATHIFERFPGRGIQHFPGSSIITYELTHRNTIEQLMDAEEIMKENTPISKGVRWSY